MRAADFTLWAAQISRGCEADDGSFVGTATLEDLDPVAAAAQRGGQHLKKTSDGIILVPQPSEDPKDPLVWTSTTSHLSQHSTWPTNKRMERLICV